MCGGTGQFNDFDIHPITLQVTDVIITCPSCLGTGKRGGSQSSTSGNSSGGNHQSGGNNSTGGTIPR